MIFILDKIKLYSILFILFLVFGLYVFILCIWELLNKVSEIFVKFRKIISNYIKERQGKNDRK